MKKLLIYISSCILLFPSCKKMLDEDVKSQATYDYLETPAGFQDATKAAYASLKTFYGQERGFTLTVFGTDTYTEGSDGAFKEFFNQYIALDGSVSIIREIWNEFYIAINTCNTVVDMAPKITGMADSIKNVRAAEARFLRAHYYFILVQMFGPIPLPLTANRSVVTEATREPLDKVYAAIIADLQSAADTLRDVKQTDYGRVTAPAAEHLLARVYLTKAGSAAKQPDDYLRALENANKVINNSSFKLLPDFAKVFEQGNGEKNEEVIWAVQNTNDPRTNGEGNRGHLYFLMEYDILPGMRRDVENGRPFKRFRPTDFTLNVLFQDRLNDTRYDKSFKHVFYANNAESIPKYPNGESKYNVGDTAIWLPGVDLTKEVIESKLYTVIPPRDYSSKRYPTLIKFLDPLRPDVTFETGSRDFLVFRLAETYLIAAEAAMYTGNNAAAAGYINEVRWRAARTSTNPVENEAYRTAMTATPGMMNIDFILDERGRELLGEQFRWFDLVRTGKLVERVKKWNPQAGAIQDKHVLRPIPQDQIDRTSNPFPQNPGY